MSSSGASLKSRPILGRATLTMKRSRLARQMPTHTIASTVAGEAADARGAGRADAAWTSAVEITRLGRFILFMVGVFHAVCRGRFHRPHRPPGDFAVKPMNS